MHDTKPLLLDTDFPALKRAHLDTLQVNLGYLCNLSCTHCHVAASPYRTELMDEDTIELVLEFMRRQGVKTLDLTGGAPEMNPYFKYLVQSARALGIAVIDRCNLTILEEPDYHDMAEFLTAHQVIITASLPCYAEQNVKEQRGKGVFEESIKALQRLNALGYGQEGSNLELNLVYNPNGAFLPPPQVELKADYKAELGEKHGIVFNELFTITNMPISRFGSMLVSKGQFQEYIELLKANYQSNNLSTVMCRSLVSVDWQGYIYDCDFNQMLEMPLLASDRERPHLKDILDDDLNGKPIAIGQHCYGCTAGQGSSCGGALA